MQGRWPRYCECDLLSSNEAMNHQSMRKENKLGASEIKVRAVLDKKKV
jgi:hypothetical protein